MKRVHVVAWHYQGGAGFDWYTTPEAADKAFEEEKQNAREFKADEWEAYRFDFDTSGSNADEITSEIDADLDGLCVGEESGALNRQTYRDNHSPCARCLKIADTIPHDYKADDAPDEVFSGVMCEECWKAVEAEGRPHVLPD